MTTHSIRMGGTSLPAGYDFGAHFVSEKIQMVGRIGTAGALNAQYIHSLTPHLLGKLTAVISPDEERTQFQAEAEYDGADFSVKATGSNSGAYTASLLQSITENGSVGMQVVSQPRQGVYDSLCTRKYFFLLCRLLLLRRGGAGRGGCKGSAV